MVAKLDETTTGMVIMTPDEIRQAIDVEARERLGMSGDVFLARWMRHDLPDSSATSDIGILARLLDLETPRSL